MWSFPMKQCGSGGKGLAELNQLTGVEQSNYRDGNSKEGHGLSEEDESHISKDFGDDRSTDIVLAGGDSGKSHTQPQASSICWDRFLPTRSIKVMLVENDESTRHVLSVLLRNCSYEVTAVANGMQAWKILEGSSIQVDIVLTELTMPGLSGISLLEKIKGHETLKNMPVIITSAQDSMGIVFKCLSKGAADFLVKPIRKNELKNLWQHIWRKLNYSSGSGSVKQTKAPVKSIGAEESNNNDSSNIGNDGGSTGLNNRDGSDDASCTESFWDRNRIEVHCAPNHLSSEAFASSWKPVAPTAVHDLDCNAAMMGKDLEMGCRTIAALQPDYPSGKVLKKGEKVDGEVPQTEVECDMESDETRAPAPDLMSLIAKNNIGDGETNGKLLSSRELPFLELSLKQVGDGRICETQDHSQIRRSRFSAFTRYSSSTLIANQAPSGNVGSCSPPDNSSEAVKGESSGTLVKQSFNGSSDNNDKGSTTYIAPSNSLTIPAMNSNHSTSAFKRVEKENHNLHPQQPTVQTKGVTIQAKESGQRQQADNFQLHQKKQKTTHDDFISDSAQQHQLPNYFNAPMTAVISVDGTSGLVPGCYVGRSGHTGKVVHINNAEVPADNIDTRNIGKHFTSVAGIPFPSRMDALNKYRQKKKDRCFRKKVRYQSRKQLAEQRPRVKGQFVRRATYNNHAKDQLS